MSGWDYPGNTLGVGNQQHPPVDPEPCRECDAGVKHLHCPAGGPHVYAVQEEPGSGRTWVACDECGEEPPPDPDSYTIVRRVWVDDGIRDPF